MAMDVLCVVMSATEARAMLQLFGGSLLRIFDATREELKRVPGIGDKKLDKFWEAFHAPIMT